MAAKKRMAIEAQLHGSKMLLNFYVYEHWRPDTDMPFYVGKGTGGRATIRWWSQAASRSLIKGVA